MTSVSLFYTSAPCGCLLLTRRPSPSWGVASPSTLLIGPHRAKHPSDVHSFSMFRHISVMGSLLWESLPQMTKWATSPQATLDRTSSLRLLTLMMVACHSRAPFCLLSHTHSSRTSAPWPQDSRSQSSFRRVPPHLMGTGSFLGGVVLS